MRVDDMLNDLKLLDRHGIEITGYAICSYDVDYTPVCTEYGARSREEFVSRARELYTGHNIFTAIIRIVIEERYRLGIYYPFNYSMRLWRIAWLKNLGVLDHDDGVGPIEKLLATGASLHGYPILEGLGE